MSPSTPETGKPSQRNRRSVADLLAQKDPNAAAAAAALPGRKRSSASASAPVLAASLGAVAIEHAGTGAGRTQWTEKAKLVGLDPSGRRTAAQLDLALQELDRELEAMVPALEAPIEIKAIGGYALIKQSVRREERAFTLDIDTMTMDYSPRVRAAIETVGQRLGMQHQWLNNDNLLDGSDPELVEVSEMEIEAKWLPQKDLGLKNIKLSIADIPTLTRSKIAAASITNSGRGADLPDLEELLAIQQIETYGQFDKAYGPVTVEHYDAHRIVAKRFGVELPPLKPSKSDQMREWADDFGFDDEAAGFDFEDEADADVDADLDDWADLDERGYERDDW
jgi:hypothetical protein